MQISRMEQKHKNEIRKYANNLKQIEKELSRTSSTNKKVLKKTLNFGISDEDVVSKETQTSGNLLTLEYLK